MRSIYRIKRLAIASLPVGSRSQAVRPLSTTSALAFRPATRTLSEQGGMKWSDKGERDLTWSDKGDSHLPEVPAASTSSSSSTPDFFTASRPSFRLAVPPASPSEASALQALYPLLYRHAEERTEELCKSIWRIYGRISPSTRRALHPTIQRMVLRAVIPSYASRIAFKRRAQDPVRAFAGQSARLERRLQVVVADMIRSSWIDPDGASSTKAPEIVPSRNDYRYAMSILSHLGGTEACEAIYRELAQTLDEPSAASPLSATLLSYRLQALKVWMTERLDVKDWTWKRPHMAQSSPLLKSLRWRADRQSRNPVQYAITVMWDILREIGDEPASASPGGHKTYGELVVVLRRILEFLPDSEDTVRATLQKILQQALEKGYGIDFRFLRQDPAHGSSTPILPSVLDAVMYLMGSRGDVWRMAAMYESLTDPMGSSAAASSTTTAFDGAVELEDEEMVETLSSALQAEAVSRESLDWLGRTRAGEDHGASSLATARTVRNLPPHLTFTTLTSTARQESQTDVRRYNDFIPSVTPPIIATTVPKSNIDMHAAVDAATGIDSSSSPVRVQVDTISTMLRAVRRSGQVDLAVHLLRTALRDAATTRNTWLSHVLRNSSLDPTLPETSQARWPTQRSLLVSASWFETVHLLARTQPNATPVADLLRAMMEVELQAIQEEYHLLTGSNDIQESLDAIDPEAPIYRIPTAVPSPSNDNSAKTFDAKRHLQQLQRTRTDLLKLLAVSVHQVEQRRLLTAASNARRAERAAEAAQQEAERVEAKKAGRRKREEVHAEATLSLA